METDAGQAGPSGLQSQKRPHSGDRNPLPKRPNIGRHSIDEDFLQTDIIRVEV